MFCPYDSAPYKDKFTLFHDRAGFDESVNNQGFLPGVLPGGMGGGGNAGLILRANGRLGKARGIGDALHHRSGTTEHVAAGVDVLQCPNRANVVVKLPDGRAQILHVDRMCNECGNCLVFCPYARLVLKSGQPRLPVSMPQAARASASTFSPTAEITGSIAAPERTCPPTPRSWSWPSLTACGFWSWCPRRR